MENHPIPQDITGFQFKLIGSMTVKQFLYLAVGVIISWFFFQSSLFFFIKWPLVLLFGGGGAALAFVPIGGRSMDTMILHFINAFFKDTTYIYDSAKQSQTHPVLSETPAPPNVTHAASIQLPSVQKKEPVYELHVSPSTPLKPEVIPAPPTSTVSEPPTPTTSPQTVEHQKMPKVEVKPVSSPQPVPQSPITSWATIRQVPAAQTASAGIPATPEVPNLVTGIIKDPRGNPLPNILVEIKDKEGNPVRAFKTNGLGHFASATPLTDGSYTIDFEDIKSQNKFQQVQFEAKGQVVMPFEIISTDKREELRKELFQN